MTSQENQTKKSLVWILFKHFHHFRQKFLGHFHGDALARIAKVLVDDKSIVQAEIVYP